MNKKDKKSASRIRGNRYIQRAMRKLYLINPKKGWRRRLYSIIKDESEKKKFYLIVNKLRKDDKPILAKLNKDKKKKKLLYLPYKQYLKTPHWQRVRKYFKGKPCFNCGEKKYIHIHHVSYNNRGNYKKEINDCIPLCKYCHKELHDFAKKEKLSVTIATKEFLLLMKFRFPSEV